MTVHLNLQCLLHSMRKHVRSNLLCKRSLSIFVAFFFFSLSLCLYTYRFSLICSMHFHPGFVGPYFMTLNSSCCIFLSILLFTLLQPFVPPAPQDPKVVAWTWKIGVMAQVPMGSGSKERVSSDFWLLEDFGILLHPSMIKSWLMTTKLALYWRRNRLKIRVRIRDPSPLVRLSFTISVLTRVG